ncbi:unnamed protein product [Effrenium voratum]|uniref:Nonsense-mediated mRNA decay factor SMG8 n=1 Tax=Effrenium voratum TaxID=2562239 RepID=A0AA36IZM1_9DINO|nr:unnamed protein product [Effrenium voratum]
MEPTELEPVASEAPTVLGLVGPASETGRILEQLYLCPTGSHALELDLGPVQCFYQRQDHVLFLCLDTSGCWTLPQDGEDCQYLLKCGNLELQNLMGLLLLFELCHVLLWLCPGQSPRLHADTLRALAKVKEVQAQYSKAENRFPPLVIFVHRELKLPFDQAGHQLFESLERVLDNRWRTCLKRLKLLQENKRGLLRVHRPCAVAMDSSPQVPKDLGLVKEPGAAMDRLRSRLVEALEACKKEPSSFDDWLASADALHRRLRASMSGPLPEELATAVGEAAAEEPLSWSLGTWAYPELFFAFSTSQDAIDEACRGFGANGSAERQEEQLKAAEQMAQQKATAPFQRHAAAETRKLCERLAKRPCKARSLSGRSCALLEGHKEQHRGASNFRSCLPCLCGKSQVQLADSFVPPQGPAVAMPSFGSCCHNASFMPFLPLTCDFEMDPVLIPPSPRLGKIKPGSSAMRALPSALPEAKGFVALVADAPLRLDPKEGAQLPGFADQLQMLSRWRPAVGSEVFLGFEPLGYSCPQGHRFFGPAPRNSGVSSDPREAEAPRRRRKEREVPGEEGEYEVAPLCPYRLYVPCVQHRRREKGQGTPCVAQLTRIWVKTPARADLDASPRVALVDTSGDVGPDGKAPEIMVTGGKVALPRDMVVQLVLPTTYFRPDGSALPNFWDLGNEAERCRLLPYLLALRTS